MTEKNRILQVLIHVIGWGFVFGFPLFFMLKQSNPMTWEKYLGYLFVPVYFMVVFYVNYLVMIERLLFRKKVVGFILFNLALFVVLSFCLDLWQGFYFSHFVQPSDELRPGPPRSMFILRDGVMMALVAGLSVAIRMTGNWYVVENEKNELEKARAEAVLQNLKNQLNPHFLFNTLNNIYSLIAINPDKAQVAVHDLSHLLRHVLYEDKQREVPLGNELTFIRSYIELMSLRLSGNVKLDIDLLEDDGGIVIAPLLFITLIENAFKHGVSPIAPSYIRICLRTEGVRLVKCSIENSYFPKRDNDRSGSGIGLENLRKRLDLLYPGKYVLKTGQEGERFRAEMLLFL